MFQIGDRWLLIAEFRNRSCLLASHDCCFIETTNPAAAFDLPCVGDSEYLFDTSQNAASELRIVLKELNETAVWLQLILENATLSAEKISAVVAENENYVESSLLR